MLDRIRPLIIPITLGTSFFLFGFFTTAQLLGLSGRELIIGLLAGAACGITTLAATMLNSRPANPAAVQAPSR